MANHPPLPALATLYERYGHAVYARCRYLLRDDDAAWDATQEVFIKAERGRRGFAGNASHQTWLSSIATHHCLNALRSQRVRLGQGRLEIDALDDARGRGAFLPAEADSETALAVRAVLDLFDATTQVMAVHYYVDEMSQEEVAVAVGLSVPTVRKRLRAFIERARRALTPAAPMTHGRP